MYLSFQNLDDSDSITQLEVDKKRGDIFAG